MAENGKTLEYLVKLVADASGATITLEQAAKIEEGLKRINDTSEKGADSQKNLAHGVKQAHEAFGQLKESGRAGREVLEGIVRMSEGGRGSIFGFAQSFRGLTGILRASVGGGGAFGLALAAIGAVAGGLLIFGKRSEEARKQQEELRRKLKESSDAAVELEGRRLDAFGENIQRQTSRATSLQLILEKTVETMGKVARAQADADIAKIQSDPKLSDVEKVRQVDQINSRFTKEERVRQETVTAGQVRTAETIAQTTKEAAEQMEARVAAMRANLAATEKAKEEADKKVADLERERSRLAARLAGAASPGIGASTSETDRTNDRKQLADVTEQLARARVAREIENSPQAAFNLETARTNLSKNQTTADALRKAANEAAENLFATKGVAEAERAGSRDLFAAQDAKTTLEARNAQRDALFGIGASPAARDVLGYIHALPGERSPEQEKAAAARALEINRDALAKDGRQAGEEMGEAVALALSEVFPNMKQAFQDSLRSTLREFDRKIRADIEAMKRDNALNQAQTRDLRN